MYRKDILEVLEEVNSNMEGLSNQEAKQRNKEYGLNELEEAKKDNPFKILMNQLKDLLVIILIIAAIVSGLSGQIESSIVIVVVIFVNAVLGTIQTLKAEKSIDSLKKLTCLKTKVIRENNMYEINSNELAIGDIVFIEAGDIISGDGRLLEVSSLMVNESALTGEVESINKTIETINSKKSIGDRKNMVFSGSLVTDGTGKYVVTSIGMNTEIGKIAHMLNTAKERKTPLQKSLDQFSKVLSILIIIICIIVFLLNILIAKLSMLDAMMIAVALAVAAIPEALSSIVTIVLSLSTQSLTKENAIVKNLNSVESLGCVSVICSDKTGTLTQNKMTPQTLYFYDYLITPDDLNSHNHDHSVMLKSCLLCNNAVVRDNARIGDPTELALIDLVNRYTVNDIHFKNTAVRVSELPFDSNRKLMSVSSLNHIYTKGALDVLLNRCTHILVNNKKEKLTKTHISSILNINEQYAKEGLRVLAFAYKDFNGVKVELKDENNLTFVGLVSLMDPPREESYDAVEKCKIAGIKPIMITGDHVLTATSIAKKIGIYKEGEICIEGHELEKMSEQELDDILAKISVYARVSPEHKIRIVKAWQKRGDIVAMSGDGVNDAPALKQSDIGVAMGISGTEVSKDAANMILMDDNFSTIVKAVITGRNVYKNIKNAIKYLLSGNFAAILCVLITSLLLLPTPFLPVHLLFMNLITDSLPAIAIGMEKEHSDVLKEKPRQSNESILNKQSFMQILFEGILISLTTLLSYLYGYQYSAALASTMAFATICLGRLLHGFNCRGDAKLKQLGLLSNEMSIYAFIIGFVLLHCVLFVPFVSQLFLVKTVTLMQLSIIYTMSLLPTIIIQLCKK